MQNVCFLKYSITSRKKQTYIPKKCSIILLVSIDIRMFVRYNASIKNKCLQQMFGLAGHYTI